MPSQCSSWGKSGPGGGAGFSLTAFVTDLTRSSVHRADAKVQEQMICDQEPLTGAVSSGPFLRGKAIAHGLQPAGPPRRSSCDAINAARPAACKCPPRGQEARVCDLGHACRHRAWQRRSPAFVGDNYIGRKMRVSTQAELPMQSSQCLSPSPTTSHPVNRRPGRLGRR
jgi:hypothetical protein